jgi:transposase-like protein
MVKRRKWSSKEKSRIVLEGLKGRQVSDICTEHQISQSMYYAWRDLFLSHMNKAFEVKQAGRREVYQNKKIIDMKQIIADLIIELKKKEEEVW